MIRKLLNQFKYGQKGFTLIELLVVVAILGVLAAVAIPNVSKFIGTGKSEAAKTELENVRAAVTAFMSQYHFGWATETGEEDGPSLTVAYLVSEGLIMKQPKHSYSIDKYGNITQTIVE